MQAKAVDVTTAPATDPAIAPATAPAIAPAIATTTATGATTSFTGTASAAPGTSFSGTASAVPAPWLSWLSTPSNTGTSTASKLDTAQNGAVEQGPLKADALETALEPKPQTRQVALETALEPPPDGTKLSAMARRSFAVDGPLLLSARCHLVRDCT